MNKKIKDKTPKYRVEYYKDDYNSLHQTIMIDLEEEKRSNGKSTMFYRTKINPNLTHHYRNLILNKNWEVIQDYKLEDY